MRCTPLTFLMTGFTWLLLASLLGIATLIGLVNGTPLPNWLRTIHVHGSLIGGLLQLTIGGFLFKSAHSSATKTSHTESHGKLYVTLNIATIALLVCLGIGHQALTGVTGLVIMGVVASLMKKAWMHAEEEFDVPAGIGWIYRTVLVALLIGLGVGVAMAFRLLPGYYAHARLLHLHLIVTGFFTVAFLLATHQLLAGVLKREILRPSLARLALGALPIGLSALLAGFVTSSLRSELAIGIFLAITIGFTFFNLISTWVGSHSAGTAASDHLLIGIFFLFLAAITGIAMGANYLPATPFFPMGTLHLVAYTHLAFIGFMVQVVFGALSYGLPILLANSRVPNPKKRALYREQIESIMNRWRPLQLGTLSLGTMGLAVLAALTWSMPLSSPSVESAVWITSGLLLGSFALFSAKLAWALGLQPSTQAS